jgi:RHS repeat-associated protein
VWQADYEPFGRVQLINPSLSLNPRLPGQYFDAETGLYQNWHRDYDARLGRYLESDPIGLEGGLNPYTYVSGNPVNAVDPFGLDETTIRVPAPPFVFPKGSPGYDATLNALNALSDAMHSAVDAVKQACSEDDEEECLQEIQSCIATCISARNNKHRMPQVWGGSWWKCMTGCVSFGCQDYLDETKHGER